VLIWKIIGKEDEDEHESKASEDNE